MTPSWFGLVPLRLPPRAIAALLLVVFGGLVGFGVTGSSVDLLFKSSSRLLSADSQVIAGNAQLVRPDDWAVLTPMAVAQTSHEPRFPIVNRNLGPDGHNMLVIGMAGVPVWHVSALARPATWGYFVFDLKRALAWAWWMPVFGCLFALWGVMTVVLQGRSLSGLATALMFVSSSYVVAWSNWPAYAVFFPSAALWCAYRVLYAEKVWLFVIYALGIGVAVAGFVLILYPPWQVSLGYLFLVVALGLVWRDQLLRRVNRWHLAVFGFAAVLTVAVLYVWWQDAVMAIQALQATVYPGQRTALTGGDIRVWQLVKGFLNHYTLYKPGPPGTNPSESASFLYMLLPALFAVFVGVLRSRQWFTLEGALAFFCLWVVYFQLIGIPAGLAELTFWGRVPAYRADLALGLASIMLSALVVCRRQLGHGKIFAVTVSFLWALVVAMALLSTPEPDSGPFTGYPVGGAFIFALIGSVTLLMGIRKIFFTCFLLFSTSASLLFNPLALAPASIKANSLFQASKHDTNSEHVLVLGNHIHAMALLSAGVPVVNGVFYYPQETFWSTLDPQRNYQSVFNRYQHLLFLPASQAEAPFYTVQSPQADVVVVNFDPRYFDFSRTGAGFVVAPLDYILSGNVSLNKLKEDDEFQYYAVQKPVSAQ